MWHAPKILFQVESGEDDLANDHSQRVRQDVLLLLVCCFRCRRHDQPENIQVRGWNFQLSQGFGKCRMLIFSCGGSCAFFYNFLQYDRISYDGSSVDRMDDDYDDFFNRQDISEGKDDDEDKDIPSVSLSFRKNMVYS